MTILKTLKDKVKNYLFKDELVQIQGELAIQKEYTDLLDDRRNHLEESIKNPQFVLQNALKVYGPFPDPLGEYDDVIDYIETQGEKDGLDKNTFFNEISDVAKNNSFKALIGFLMKEQLIFIGTKSESDMMANYARATLNAMQLFSTEIETINNYNKKRNEPEEQFDEHGVINGED